MTLDEAVAEFTAAFSVAPLIGYPGDLPDEVRPAGALPTSDWSRAPTGDR
jgi:hypothetical protein